MLATWSALQWSPHCHQGKGIDCLAWPPHTIPWGRHNLGLSAWAHGTAVRPCSIRSFSFPPAAATELLGRPFWDFRHPLWTNLQRSSYLNQPTLKSSNSLRIHLCIMMRVQTFTLLRLPRHCILEYRSYVKETLTSSFDCNFANNLPFHKTGKSQSSDTTTTSNVQFRYEKNIRAILCVHERFQSGSVLAYRI